MALKFATMEEGLNSLDLLYESDGLASRMDTKEDRASSANFDSSVTPEELVDCAGYISNVSLLFSEEFPSDFDFKYLIDKIAVPMVGIFGIIGNILNLVVLTRKRLQHSMDRMEKSATMGLVALAVSDLVVCLVYLIRALVGPTIFSQPNAIDLRLYFNAFEEALVNVAVLTSTWFTVAMAVSRYRAVCRPLDARGQTSLRRTRITLVLICLGSLLINLPRFSKYKIVRFRCPLLHTGLSPAAEAAYHSCGCFYDNKEPGWMLNNESFTFWYGLVYSCISMFIPLPVLTACNVSLVQALRRSTQLQRSHCRASTSVTKVNSRNQAVVTSHEPSHQAQHRITPTLIGLIALFLVLVAPSEIMAFFSVYIIRKSLNGNPGLFRVFQISLSITNFLLLINFAVNFVLYCVVNSQFRRAGRQLLSCRLGRGSGRCCCCWKKKVEGNEESNENGTLMKKIKVQLTVDSGSICGLTCNRATVTDIIAEEL